WSAVPLVSEHVSVKVENPDGSPATGIDVTALKRPDAANAAIQACDESRWCWFTAVAHARENGAHGKPETVWQGRTDAAGLVTVPVDGTAMIVSVRRGTLAAVSSVKP